MAQPDPRIATASATVTSVAGRITAALLLLREKHAAKLLEAVLDKKDLSGLAAEKGLNPLPGKRFKTMTPTDHALCLVRGMVAPSKQQSAVVAAVVERMPAPLDGVDLASDTVNDSLVAEWSAQGSDVDHAFRVRALLALVLDPARRDLVARLLDADYLAIAAAPPPQVIEEDPRDATIRRLEQRIARFESERAALAHEHEERERGLKLRLDQAHAELAEMQARVGKKHREAEELRTLYETAKSDLELAFRRAARFKQSLDEAKSHTEREQELLDAYAREKQRADIEAAKVEILEYELDALAHEDEPSAGAAETSAAHPVHERILKFVAARGARPRVLIVGGAGKQRSHRERDFEAMKARLEIDGEWRFADYGSWHRDLPRLRNDIQHRFDLVFVLHWNRTTFVQKMHDEARALNRRVRTVPYRGFLSLERAIVEELERFLTEHN
jgi:hypothetical protein